MSEGSVFERKSDIEQSRSDDLRIFIDRSIIAPFRIVLEDLRGVFGLSILVLYVLMGTVGVVLIAPPEPYSARPMMGPFQSLQHPLGTDNLGESLFAQIVHATPAMFKMIIGGAVFAVILAIVVGTYAGYVGGLSDRILSTIIDVMMTIPGLPLIIVISVIFEPRDPFIVGIILSINVWAGLARTLRSEVLSIREESYVEASQIIGVPTPKIIVSDLLPNLMPYITINFVNAARQIIFSSVALYFLGILPFTTLNWGVIMNLSYRTGSSLSQWSTFYWFAFPTLAVVLLSMALVMIAQSLDRVFNPRVRARHAQTIDTE